MSSLLSHVPLSLAQAITAAYFRGKSLLDLGLRGVHSAQSVISHQDKMKIRILPALSDNYMYLLIDNATKEAAIVDPVAPATVQAAVKEENVKLTAILTTHHHWDHAGGNKEMSQLVKGLTVYGGDDRIDALNKKVSHGDQFSVGGLNVRCLFTPCHTAGHICYFVESPNEDVEPAVFTGDTLFLGGCGRFFEGTADQMYEALVEKLGSLPDETKVYCGHEYSLQNLKFGATVEPDNQAIKSKLAWCQQRRRLQPPQPTAPSTIGEERQINPFVRVTEESVQSRVDKKGDSIGTMAAVRSWKDNFKA